MGKYQRNNKRNHKYKPYMPATESKESQTNKEKLDPKELRRDISTFVSHIEEKIAEEQLPELSVLIQELHPSDLADIMQSLGFEEAKQLFALIPPEEQGETLYELPEKLAQRFMRDVLSPPEVAAILEALPSDMVTDILGLLKVGEVGDILIHLPFKERNQILELLSYPEDTAGALMDKDFVSVQEKQTISKAISTLRKAGRDIDDVHTIYVTDTRGRYKGNVSLAKMILARPQSKIKRIMEDEIPAIPVLMDQEEVADFFTKYNLITAPVVDEHGVMLGRITVDDILEVVREEASEDILRMGGMSGEETLDTPIWKSSLQRIVWLAFNLLTAFLASGVVKAFESTIEKVVILAALMPIVAGMGGNAGGQTMALVVRNLAIGELTWVNARKTFGRELGIGLLNGLVIGCITASVVYLISGHPVLAAIMGTAILANLLIAAAAGTLLPLLLERFHIDPAIASSILVTTCTDSMGFFIFLGLARFALPYIK